VGRPASALPVDRRQASHLPRLLQRYSSGCANHPVISKKLPSGRLKSGRGQGAKVGLFLGGCRLRGVADAADHHGGLADLRIADLGGGNSVQVAARRVETHASY
jgi:hypothetical protein